MVFNLSKNKIGYFIEISSDFNSNDFDNSDLCIAKYLGIDLKEYIKILNKFKGYNIFKYYYFKNKYDDNNGTAMFFSRSIDCKKAINYLNENLDKFLIAKELTK